MLRKAEGFRTSGGKAARNVIAHAYTNRNCRHRFAGPAPVLGSFVSKVVLTFGTRLLMMVGVFGSGVIVARWLGDEGFGTYAVLSVMVALAVQIGSAGLPSANTFSSRAIERRSGRSSRMRSSLDRLSEACSRLACSA